MLGKQKTTIFEVFGQVVRRQRKARGMSQEALAFEAGIQRNYVSLIELGRNQPTITTVFKLANALSIKPAKLIQMVDDVLTSPR